MLFVLCGKFIANIKLNWTSKSKQIYIKKTKLICTTCHHQPPPTITTTTLPPNIKKKYNNNPTCVYYLSTTNTTYCYPHLQPPNWCNPSSNILLPNVWTRSSHSWSWQPPNCYYTHTHTLPYDRGKCVFCLLCITVINIAARANANNNNNNYYYLLPGYVSWNWLQNSL